jgi:hypothetical protein
LSQHHSHKAAIAFPLYPSNAPSSWQQLKNKPSKAWLEKHRAGSFALLVSLDKLNVSLKGLECISGALENISGRLGCTSGGLGLALDFIPARPWNRRGVVHLLKI